MRVSWIRRSIIFSTSIFPLLVVGQGGQYGFPASPACSAGTTAYQKFKYLGCYDLGINGASTLTQAGVFGNNSASHRGTGRQYYSFTTSNTGATSFPGYLNDDNDPTALWATSHDPYNCSVTCTAHGFKYMALPGDNVCYCGSFPPNTTQSDTRNPPIAFGGLSVCHRNLFLSCLADTTQFCGAPGSLNPIHYQADVYVDTSFGSEAQNLTIGDGVQERYGYLGCFNTLPLIPFGMTNAYFTSDDCYSFCASLNLPLAAVQYDSSKAL